MPVRLKSFATILKEWIDVLFDVGNIRDRNVGAVLQSIAEASAQTDADQYVQIGNALDSWFLFRARGDDLDLKIRDYDTSDNRFRRLNPGPSTVSVIFGDTSVAASVTGLFEGFQGGDPSKVILKQVTNLAAFLSSPVQKLILNRSSANIYYFAYTTVTDLGGGRVQFDGSTPVPLSNTPASGAVVYLSQQDLESNVPPGYYLFPAGTQVEMPQTSVSEAVVFATTAEGRIYDGDRESAPVLAQSIESGSSTNVGVGAINTFLTSPPFGTAYVRNPTPAGGGRDRESDDAYVARALNILKSRDRGTAKAIEGAVRLVALTSGPFAGESIIDAQVFDTNIPGLARCYILTNDPSYAGDPTEVKTFETLVLNSTLARTLFKVLYAPVIPQTGTNGVRLVRSQVSLGEVQSYIVNTTAETVGYVVQASGSPGWSVDQYRNWFALLESGSSRFIYHVIGNTSDSLIVTGPVGQNPTAPTDGTLYLIDAHDLGGLGLIADTDFTVNRTTGDIQLVNTLSGGLAAGDGLFTIAEIQTPKTGFITVDYGTIVDGSKVTINGTDLVARNTPSLLGEFKIEVDTNTTAKNLAETINFVAATSALVRATHEGASGSDRVYLSEVSLTGPAITVTTTGAGLSFTAASGSGSLLDEGIPEGASAYGYYNGIVLEVQKVINGDPNDFENYPGYKAAGCWVEVVLPQIQDIFLNLNIVPKQNFTEVELVDAVKTSLVNYINSLRIGQPVILATLIQKVMEVEGILDVTFTSPTGNIAIPEGKVARTSADNITVI